MKNEYAAYKVKKYFLSFTNIRLHFPN